MKSKILTQNLLKQNRFWVGNLVEIELKLPCVVTLCGEITLCGFKRFNVRRSFILMKSNSRSIVKQSRIWYKADGLGFGIPYTAYTVWFKAKQRHSL